MSILSALGFEIELISWLLFFYSVDEIKAVVRIMCVVRRAFKFWCWIITQIHDPVYSLHFACSDTVLAACYI